METDIITTETVTETAPVIVATLAEMVLAAEAALDNVKQAQLLYEQKLQEIVAAHGKTYEYDGKWYQIRSRDSVAEGRKITYICDLKDEPKTWLKGPKKKAVPAQESTPVLAMAVSTTVDGATTTVID